MRNKNQGVDIRVTNKQTLNRMVQPIPGDYKWSARTSDFNGWLICDGRSLNMLEYPELYAVLKESFGSDNTSEFGYGTFKLPDCRGRTPCAIGQGSNLTIRQLGDYVGEETHQLTLAELASHDHTGATGMNGTHNHGGSTGAAGQGVSSTDVAVSLTTTYVADDGGSHTHTISSDGDHNHSIASDGLNVAHNNMQPSVFLGNVFVYSGVVPFEAVVLDNIREWTLNTDTNVTYIDAFIDAFNYSFDSRISSDTNVTTGVMYFINDGGDDMFDGGNFIWFGGDVLPLDQIPSIPTPFSEGSINAVEYDTLFEKTDHSGGLYISGSGVYPHITITYAKSGTMSIICYGATGSDGNASVNNFNGTYTCDNGRTGQYWASINYGTSDPSIGDVWFTITKPSEWGSTITNVDDNRKTEDSQSPFVSSIGVTGTNYILCKVLLSRTLGQNITADLLTRFLSAYVQSMPENMGFNPVPDTINFFD